MGKTWLFILIAVLLTGCRRAVMPISVEKPLRAEPLVERIENESDIVLLGDVPIPAWDDVYAVLESGERSYCVDWGFSTENLTMEECSGFPGFNRPIIVTGSIPDIASEITLVTEYGEFVYSVTEEKTARLNDNGTNVVDLASGEVLVEWGKSEERLFLVDKEEKHVVIATFVRGTKIIA